MAEKVAIKPGARANPNKVLKTKVYCALFVGHYLVANKFAKIPAMTDVSSWAVVTSYCATVHKGILQRVSGKGGIIKNLMDTDQEWELLGSKRTSREIMALWESVMLTFDFTYDDNKAEWIGTMTSLLTLMSAFGRRLNEARVPPTKFMAKIKKNSKVAEEIPISHFGLDKRAAPYLEGITFAPHTKSSMLNSLGPLTIAIGLALCFDPNYSKKWIQAFKNSWGMLDFVDELAEEIEGASTSASPIIGQLATLCLFGVPRAGNKAYIPFVALIAAMLEDNDAVKTWIAKPALENANTLNASIAVENIDSSGHGMWHVYNLSLTRELTMKGNQGTGKALGQMYTHAFLGTHKDDLSLVEWMTNTNDFVTRSEIGNTLQGKPGERVNVKITRYQFQKICKLASASGTSLMAGGEGQIQRMTVLSGKCTQDVSIESKILNCLKEANITMSYRTRATVGDKLTATVDKLARRVAKTGSLEWGSTSFYLYNAEAKGANYGAVVEENFKLNGKYFFANV